MSHTVTLIAGDGVGPEAAKATQRLLAAAGADIDWVEVPAGRRAFQRTGSALPDETLDAIRQTRVALKGRMLAPQGDGYENPTVTLRRALNLYAGVRPIRSQPGLKSRYEDIDLVIIRESTEDVYSGIEHEVVPGVVQSLKVTTERASTRIAEFAFAYARAHGRKQITIVHKANIMKRSDGLFIRCAQEVADRYPEITCKRIIADNACMQLVRWPWQFDVLVAQNLFGDLLSDLGAGVVGGISAVWGLMRDATDLHVFEAIHGIAPHLEGKGVANPMTFIRPAIEMLRHLDEGPTADRIDAAVAGALDAGECTADLGGTHSTEGFVDALIGRLA